MQDFTRHRYEIPTLIVFFSLALIELFAVHLLVALWNSAAAWLLSALTVIALGQIGLLVHGMIKWPTVLDDTGVTVRHGRRGEIFVPLDSVASVDDVAFQPEEKGRHTFRATLFAQPNLAIRLSKPLPYRRRMLSAITMRLDEPAAFVAAIRPRISIG